MHGRSPSAIDHSHPCNAGTERGRETTRARMHSVPWRQRMLYVSATTRQQLLLAPCAGEGVGTKNYGECFVGVREQGNNTRIHQGIVFSGGAYRTHPEVSGTGDRVRTEPYQALFGRGMYTLRPCRTFPEEVRQGINFSSSEKITSVCHDAKDARAKSLTPHFLPIDRGRESLSPYLPRGGDCGLNSAAKLLGVKTRPTKKMR